MTSSLPTLTALLRLSGPENPTDNRVMDVARELFLELGTGFTIDDVVVRSGVSRATIFRRFGSKDSVIQRTFQREIGTVLTQIVNASAQRPTAAERAVELFASTLATAVRQPMLRHLATSNPAALAQLGSTGDPSPLTMVARVMTDALLLAAAELGEPLPLPVDHLVDLLIHVVAGYTYFRNGPLEESDEATIRHAAEVLVTRLLPTPNHP
ncbi:TetR/AcrR family transcriptional regulator [Nocardia nepalensis]|uniref:TetR/AcrR family transcriptional regulator n=1 Tax=Nocardia nepalensis TaxID=3375448 RepID=UPI003B6717F9